MNAHIDKHPTYNLEDFFYERVEHDDELTFESSITKFPQNKNLNISSDSLKSENLHENFVIRLPEKVH